MSHADMTALIHTFDVDGYYTGSSELPPFAAAPNPEVATLDPLPGCDESTHRARRVGEAWVVEAIPEPEPEPELPSAKPQYPLYFGNDKLDKLFTLDEQIAVVTAAMTDPVVKLMYDRLLGAAYLTYEDPDTEKGLSLLVNKSLLTKARKAEIVSEMQPK